MLKTLTVQDFALLQQITVEFGAGLNILTGETGAGKSILIDSLGAILGGRLSANSIRTGAEQLRIEAVFSVEHRPDLENFLAEQAIDADDDEIIVMRRLTRAGRSTALVNGVHVTQTTLKKLGAFLVDIHGQNENLAILKEENQFALIDGFDEKIADALDSYNEAYETWTAKKKLLEEKENAAKDYAEKVDLLNWQLKEIEEAELTEGEDDELEADINRLSHAEKIAEYVSDSCELLESGVGGTGIIAAIAELKNNLDSMARFDDELKNARAMIDDAYVSLQEASYDIKDYASQMDFNPARLDKLQQRMDVIYRLKKKYGATVKDILAYEENVRQELSAVENFADDAKKLKEEIKAAEALLAERAAKLTAERKSGAKKLSAAIEKRLRSLGMPKARFAANILPSASFGTRGADEISLDFSANPGEDMKPLKDAASGGELARIALATKAVNAAKDDSAPCMVFDEIDTGLGGRTAKMAAECIALVASRKQVLCITHLPQIAAMADVHLYIVKHSSENRTMTHVQKLTDTERISEIARMASGADATAASLDNAREMLLNAKMTKADILKAQSL